MPKSGGPDGPTADQSKPGMSLPVPAPATQPSSGASSNDQSTSATLPLSQPPNTVNSPAATDSPAVAADSDLIEKEWVQKAKAIVEKTRQDPYLQNKEITKAKADYLKKRYNKVIKVTEE